MLNKYSSAFPWEDADGEINETGLKAREYIATHILSGIAAGSHMTDSWLAARAVRLADMLIEELNKSAE
jgi:hypothetical protein